MCWKLPDIETHVSQVCRKQADPGSHMSGGQRPFFLDEHMASFISWCWG